MKLFQVNIRLTESEHQLAKDLADLAGSTVTNWFRACAFSKKRPAAKQKLINRKLFIDLSRIGNNINQLAHHANSGNPILASELPLLKELKEAISQIQQKLLEL
ncbi:MobC family plasmid mobilization relaxosome protein [Marinilabilia sp.]|uniref:MobC family plasmid mobilization relaxosome protein n=1 Tax=Marinilabilia sp. TaxID=2021252 RepID=UPI0025C44D8A|nr:MobC family plasmid mobilization relaxosome protein [Marinilabilia sp.]